MTVRLLHTERNDNVQAFMRSHYHYGEGCPHSNENIKYDTGAWWHKTTEQEPMTDARAWRVACCVAQHIAGGAEPSGVHATV